MRSFISCTCQCMWSGWLKGHVLAQGRRGMHAKCIILPHISRQSPITWCTRDPLQNHLHLNSSYFLYLLIWLYIASSLLWNVTLIWIPDDDPKRYRNKLDWLTRYCNIEYLKTIQCILLDWILCDLIVDSERYKQHKIYHIILTYPDTVCGRESRQSWS
jgi:hypothetical protein